MNQQNSASAPELPKNDAAEQQPSAQSPTNLYPRPEDRPKETGGQKGLEPTRYGDWEKNGRCTDF